jgi:hypothetical protein
VANYTTDSIVLSGFLDPDPDPDPDPEVAGESTIIISSSVESYI